jgi:Protein of unknown function (DUF2608)
MNKNIALVLALLIGVTSINAEIVETKHFKEITSYVTPETLVLVDIDDTLLITHQMLGCDEWFKYRIEKYQKEGLSFSGALEKTLAESEAVRHLTQMHLVESGTDKIIQSLQEKGVCVMGLTIQGLALATRTSQHLQANGIDLKQNALSKQDQLFPVHGHSMIYRNGILFTSGSSKGEAISALLDKMDVHPKRIVLIDDKATNLADVEQMAKKRQVEFVGLRYSYSDAKKAAFRPEVTEVQFSQSTFDHLLTDEEASALIAENQKK